MNQEPAHEPTRNDAVAGATELADVLAAADAEGCEVEFDVADDQASPDHLRCPRCGAVRPASTFTRAWSRRLEGASDPADMLHVSAIECPQCGVCGVFITPFGPASTERQSAVLRSLPEVPPRRRSNAR